MPLKVIVPSGAQAGVWAGLCAGLCLVLLTACAVRTGRGVQPEPQEPLGEYEMLAFTHATLYPLPRQDVYLLDDLHGLRPLDGEHDCAMSPTWSADGTQLMYVAGCGGARHFYIAAGDGSSPRRLPSGDGQRGSPSWSPDGKYVAYWAQRQPGEPFLLYLTGTATGDTHSLPVESVEALMWQPGSQSLVIARRTEDAVLTSAYKIEAKLSRNIAAAPSLRDAAHLTLSPGADKLAYIVPLPEEDWDSLNDPLYVANLDGTEAIQVGNLSIDGSIVWSPDGDRIAYVALNDEAYSSLYLVNADGTGHRELMVLDTGDESGEILPAAPVWSPDGTRIAISSYISDLGSAVFVIDADNQERRQVTTASGLIYDLAWRPGKP